MIFQFSTLILNIIMKFGSVLLRIKDMHYLRRLCDIFLISEIYIKI